MRLSVIAVGIVTTLLSTVVFGQVSHAERSLSQVNGLMPGGVAAFRSQDQGCYDRAKAAYGQSGDVRTALNAPGAAYITNMWASQSGRPATNNMYVPYGTTGVPLQINATTLICSVFMQPTLTGDWYLRGNYRNNTDRIVSSSNPDSRPNASTGSTYSPAWLGNDYDLNSVRVVSGPGSVSGNPDRLLSIRRKDDTRYWDSTPARGFTFNMPGGITRAVTITIEVRYKVRVYSEGWMRYSGAHCATPYPPVISDGGNFQNCNYETTRTTFTIQPAWVVDPYITVNRTSASPGQDVQWRHSMRNRGPEALNTNSRMGYQDSWRNIGNRVYPGTAAWTLRNGSREGASITQFSTHRVGQDDVGKTMCRRTAAEPYSRLQLAPGAPPYILSGPACVTVPFNYNLTPMMAITPSTVIEPGEDTIEVNGGLRNSGPTKSRQAPTMITRMQIPKGTSLPTATTTSTYTGGDAMQAACAYFRPQAAGMKRCDVQAPTSGGTVFAANYSAGIPGGQYSDDIAGLNLAVGDKVCYVASVNLYSVTSAANSWRHSPVRCAEVAKSPKVQIKGGSLYAGRAQPGGSGNDDAEVITGIGTKKVGGTNRVFGSWIEYGIFATGAVDSASGATLAGKDGADIAMQALKARNPLTFENRSTVGEFGDLGTIANLRAKFTSASRSCSGLTLGGAASGVYTCSNTATLSGEVALGKSLIIKAPRIDITGDIRYASGHVSSLKDIPQLVLISDNITISGNVGTVDAWLVGDSRGGTVNGFVVTCPDTRTGRWTSTNYTGGLTDTVCANQLQVNGPVMANKLFLRRTAGSTAAEPNAPAEVFNMRADAYLWAQNYGGGETSIEATYTRDLAPRF